MIFKKLAINEQYHYTDENMSDLSKIIKKNCEKAIGPSSDIQSQIESLQGANDKKPKKRKIRRDNEFILRDVITALSLCHNVTPAYEDGIKVLQASSPDEVFLKNII